MAALMGRQGQGRAVMLGAGGQERWRTALAQTALLERPADLGHKEWQQSSWHPCRHRGDGVGSSGGGDEAVAKGLRGDS